MMILLMYFVIYAILFLELLGHEIRYEYYSRVFLFKIYTPSLLIDYQLVSI